MRKVILCSLILPAMLVGVSEAEQAKRIIPSEGISKLELISVTPELNPASIIRPDASKTFHGYPILGRREIENQSVINDLLGSVNKSLRPHVANLCLFFPRHGLKIFYKDSEVDYLICYQCGDVEKFQNNNDNKPGTLSIDKSSKEVLDRYLTEAKIPLAP